MVSAAWEAPASAAPLDGRGERGFVSRGRRRRCAMILQCPLGSRDPIVCTGDRDRAVRRCRSSRSRHAARRAGRAPAPRVIVLEAMKMEHEVRRRRPTAWSRASRSRSATPSTEGQLLAVLDAGDGGAGAPPPATRRGERRRRDRDDLAGGARAPRARPRRGAPRGRRQAPRAGPAHGARERRRPRRRRARSSSTGRCSSPRRSAGARARS